MSDATTKSDIGVSGPWPFYWVEIVTIAPDCTSHSLGLCPPIHRAPPCLLLPCLQGRAQDWEGQLTGKLPATCLTGSPYGPHLWGENSGEVDSQHLPPALPTLPAEAPFSRRTAAKGPATLPLLPHLPSFVLLDTYAPFSCGWLSALPAKSFTLFVFRF